MGVFLLIVCVAVASAFFELIDGLPNALWLGLAPAKGLLGLTAIALLTWLSRD